MKLNEHLQINGANVVLVPYESKHVAKYHEWMKNVELQELTASEPLSLEEEYQMQKSWREDEDKCTFLVLDRQEFERTGDEIAALIGDTNIFLRLPPADGTDNDGDAGLVVGEIEIMIAEPTARGKRCGWEATLLMLRFGVEYLRVAKFVAITKDTNRPAMRMFERMQFNETLRSAVFQEVTFERSVNPEWIDWMNSEVSSYAVVPYRNETSTQ